MKVFSGSMGTGKTTRLLAAYHELIAMGAKTGEILVLVMNATAVSDWRRRLNLSISGNLSVYTYFGLVQKEITRLWPRVEANLPGGNLTLEPVFMTTETSHYLMGLLVDRFRGEGLLPSVRATSQQIAIQLIDNLNTMAINNLSFAEAQVRFHHLAGGNREKELTFAQAVELMTEFRKRCIEARCLDYSLCVDLFNRYVLSNPGYCADLGFKYLLVDNLEESVPAAQDLIKSILPGVSQAYLGFDPTGGRTSYFGADPASAAKSILSLGEIEYLTDNFASSKGIQRFAMGLAQRITGKGPDEDFDSGVIRGQISTQFRGEMLQQVAQAIEELLKQGVPAEEIAIIAPVVDKVLEFSLRNDLQGRNVSLAILTRGKRLLDQPFAQALISLAILVYPQWNIQVNFSGLVQTLHLLLKLDPVRSSLLADEIFRQKLALPDLDHAGLRSRLGFDKSERYEWLKSWLEQRKDSQPDLESFFQQVFGELLAPLMPDTEDLLACRQLIDSVVKFRRVMHRYRIDAPDWSLGKGFLDMVLRGTLAAETLFKPPENKLKVLLATPYAFLFSPYVDAVKYQFWVDVGGDQWLRADAKELTNPQVLAKAWDGQWNDSIDQATRLARLARVTQGLLGKCSGGLFIATSSFSSHGFEQEGQLVEWLEEQGVKGNA